VALFLFSDHGSVLEVRLVLNHFRFAFRFIYAQLVEEIVKLAKHELRRLLEAIPELLPIDDEGEGDVLSEGVWRGISAREWEHALYREKVVNLYNRELIADFVKGIWFKRNWLTTHDLLAFSN
jgi:hypothetical protein